MAKLELNAWGQTHKITLSTDTYANNGNLAVQMWCHDDEEFPEPWSMLTVNLTRKCKPNCAFIDINNNGDSIIDWLIANNLGTDTGVFEISGFCIYPMFEFNMDELKKYEEEQIC